MELPFYTIGHSRRAIEAFVHLLRAAKVAAVADIRSIPRSRTNPQYNRDILPCTLGAIAIEFRHIFALGGLRAKVKAVATGTNGCWENRSFGNYADYALTPVFREGLDELIALGREKPCAMMCSEAVRWRCHRCIVADHLLARGESVFHLMGTDKIEIASLTKGALVRDGCVMYPPADASN